MLSGASKKLKRMQKTLEERDAATKRLQTLLALQRPPGPLKPGYSPSKQFPNAVLAQTRTKSAAPDTPPAIGWGRRINGKNCSLGFQVLGNPGSWVDVGVSGNGNESFESSAAHCSSSLFDTTWSSWTWWRCDTDLVGFVAITFVALWFYSTCVPSYLIIS